MSTVHAVFENGVFRPKEKVLLPERCEVEFEPRLVPSAPSQNNLDDIYDLLSQRFASGETDVAQRHDEHQP